MITARSVALKFSLPLEAGDVVTIESFGFATDAFATPALATAARHAIVILSRLAMVVVS